MANVYLNFRSDSLSRSVYPVVFLPDLNGWNDVKPPYRTLYFLPGYSGGALETATFTNFSLYSMMYGLAIVLIDGENSFYVDDERRGAMFSRYAGQEIVEVTRRLLPLSTRREDTFIGGISMGGYGALVNALRYRETFGKVAMLSPALGFKSPEERQPGNSPIPDGELTDTLGTWKEYEHTYKDYMEASVKACADRKTMPELFLACGLQDDLVLDHAREYVRGMAKLGVEVKTFEAQGGHDHDFWKTAMTPACRFLTGKEGV